MDRVATEGAAALASRVSRALRERAFVVDEAAAFPREGIDELRASGLLGLLVPTRYGGMGGSAVDLVAVGQELATGCTATAMLWAMHCQQLACVLRHADQPLRDEVLSEVGAGRSLLASITTEPGKGGHLMTAHTPLVESDAELTLHREAPVVSAGMHADAYLVTCRSSPSAPPGDVTLAYIPAGEAELEPTTAWSTMGMRGTASIGMRVTARVSRRNLIGGLGGFNDVAVRTMIPFGHIAWASVWLGAARGALQSVLQELRNPAMRTPGQATSDLLSVRLARVRLRLDTVSAYLDACVAELAELDERRAADPGQATPHAGVPFQMRINGLKLLASEECLAAVDDLVTIGGLRSGYTCSPETPVERVFRDLRSSPLMYANDRLLKANGVLSLLDPEVTLRVALDSDDQPEILSGGAGGRRP